MTSGVTRRQKRLIQALLFGQSVKDACQQIGVSRNTAYRWMREPRFKQALQEAEAEMTGQTMRRLLGMQEEAVEALQAILSDPQASQRDKLRAIDMVLSHFLRLREAVTFEQELNELERRIEEVQDGKHGKSAKAD